MSAEAAKARLEVEESQFLLDLIEKLVQARDMRQLVEPFLEGMTACTGALATVLALQRTPLAKETFFQAGLAPEAVATVAGLCETRLRQLAPQAEPPPETLILPPQPMIWLYLYPVPRGEGTGALLGILSEAMDSFDPGLVKKALNFFACALNKKIDELEHQQQIQNLNTYLSISSMIAQSLDLKDVLEAVLYFCMESFQVEAASVLLLDYEQKNFRFYSAEGPAKPVILMASFPADQGLAGAVLATQQAEIINDV